MYNLNRRNIRRLSHRELAHILASEHVSADFLEIVRLEISRRTKIISFPRDFSAMIEEEREKIQEKRIKFLEKI